MREKEILINEVSKEIEKSFILNIVKNVVVVLLFSFALLIPKIYISSHIYILSVEINKKLNEYYSLKAENSILKSKIEKIKFENRLNIDSF